MSFPRYPKYKDSGVEWLGQVPEHWEVVKVKWVARMESGHTPDKKVPEFWDGGAIPWISLNDTGYLKDNDYISETVNTVTQLGLNNSSAHLLPPRAVVFSRDATIGRCAITTRPMAVSQHFIAWICGPRLIPEYLLLRLKSMTQELERMTTGATVKTIGMPEVRTISTPVPPASEQHAIAAFLNRETAHIDALVAEQERLIELLREKRQAVIFHAVTKGLDPTVPMKDSGVEWLGEVPGHWQTRRLKELFSIKHGYAFDGAYFSDEGEYILLTPGNFREEGGFREKTPEKYFVGSEIPDGFILSAGQMLIAMTEQAPGLVGSCLHVPPEGTYLHNQRLGLIDGLRPDLLDNNYLYFLLNSRRIKEMVGVTATGQKVRHTSPQKILAIEVVIPSRQEQAAIAEYISHSLADFENLEQEVFEALLLLNERRSALISAAVTGQIDVRGLIQEAIA